ncbi:MAG: hypothetical protein P4L59_20660 [Desulfosporosinus sp.]|nr:hypothetical protein [Desulfosporosinus sp.]
MKLRDFVQRQLEFLLESPLEQSELQEQLVSLKQLLYIQNRYISITVSTCGGSDLNT